MYFFKLNNKYKKSSTLSTNRILRHYHLFQTFTSPLLTFTVHDGTHITIVYPPYKFNQNTPNPSEKFFQNKWNCGVLTVMNKEEQIYTSQK